jgi:uncharacterized protein with ATP-grasp and redox domains
MKTCACFQTGHNEFEAACALCILRMFVSVANKGSIDCDAQWEITKHINNLIERNKMQSCSRIYYF